MEILVSVRGLFLLGLALAVGHECERHELGDCPQDNSFIQMQLSLAMDSADSKAAETPKEVVKEKVKEFKAAETPKEVVKEKVKEFKAAETPKEVVKEKVKEFKAAETPKEVVKEKVKEFKAAATAKEVVKEKAKKFKEKVKEFKAAATAKKLAKEKAKEFKAAETKELIKEKVEAFKALKEKAKEFKAAETKELIKEKVEAFKALKEKAKEFKAAETKELIKEKVEAFKEKVKDFKAAASAKKLVKATEEAAEAKNVIVVDDRNFTQLKDDLSYAGENLAVAKDLSSTFEEAVLRSTLAQHQVVKAEAERQAILKRIHKLLNKTIALEAMTKDDLILELKSFNASGVQSQTASAADMAAEAAKLAQDLSGCEARIVDALERRDAAMTQQAEAVKQIQKNLRSSIMVEMNDTRLVQILDASDRSQMVPAPTTTTTNTVLQDILDRLEVTVNVKGDEATKETAAEAPQGEVLYPTDWAVIGALVLVIVFVTAVVCYSRTQER